MRWSRLYAERLQAQLAPLRYLLLGLESFIVANPTEARDHADVYLTELIDDWPGVRNVALAPNNVVTDVVPILGNEVLLGFDYESNPEQWPAVQEAIESRRSVLAGPIDLVQGGRGMAYRMPVFLKDGSYWGIVSTVRDLDTLLEVPKGMDLPARGPVALVDAETGGFVTGDPGVLEEVNVSTNLTALERKWTVAVPVQLTSSATPLLIGLVGVVSTTVLAVLTFLLIGAAQRQRALSRMMRALGQQAPGALFQARLRPTGRLVIEYMSDGIEEITGLTADEISADSERLLARVVEADRELVRTSIAQSRPDGPRVRFDYRIMSRDGHIRWMRTEAKVTSDADGSAMWHGWISDITDEIQAAAATRVSASVFAATRDGVVILDPDGSIVDVNPAFLALEGTSRERVVGTPFHQIGQGLTDPAVYDEMWSQLGRHGVWRGEITRPRPDGTTITDSVTVSTVRDAGSAVSHYVAVLDNFNIARDDAVTGLPNRRVLDARMAQCIERARTEASRAALVSIGLDQFRQVNLAYGHRVGDELLREVAIRLADLLPHDATLVRLRGDEFAFVVEFDDIDVLEGLISEALGRIAVPLEISGRRIQASACAGITLIPDDGDNAVNLLLHADQALRAAKALGQGRHCYFAASMETEVSERAALVADLRRAVVEEQIDMFFQPIIDLASSRIVKAESLMRWRHPERGFVPPNTFIRLAEQHGFIAELTDIAFDRAISALVELRRIQPELLMTINVSPVELREPRQLHERRVQAVLDAGLPPQSLVIEITEGVLVSPDPNAAANLAVYRNAGMLFAIDDFGTGFSSLAYLQQLEVDFIKIDRSFVTGLAVGSNELALCQAIIVMARTLGLSVVAEGVETEQQWQLLAAAGCSDGQGYLFAKPMPLHDLVTWIRDRASVGAQ